MNRNNQVVDIIKIVNGGYGLARAPDGRTLLVRFALPDERVVIQVTHEQKRVAFGHAVNVLSAAPGRIDPPCPYFGRCGGCNLQHADYKTQCTIKSEVLSELVSRSQDARLSGFSDFIAPLVASRTPSGYRHRIRMKIDDRGRAGFNHFRSHKVVGVDRCLLVAEPVNRSLTLLRDKREFSRLVGLIEEIEFIHNPSSRKVSLLISLIRPPRPADRSHARVLCSDTQSLERIFFKGRNFPLEGPYCATPDDEERLGRSIGFSLDGHKRLEFCWEIGGFSQVNLEQNRRLIELVQRASRIQPTDSVLDLYCGMGNFSLPLASACKDILGIEGQGSAIRSAKNNAKTNKLANCRYIKNDVFKACRELAARRERFDLVICDPPRSGLNELTDLLPELTRQRLIYVSCDPATLCRDLEKLIGRGFVLKTLQPVDMFPHTHHIETLAVLEKRSEGIDNACDYQ